MGRKPVPQPLMLSDPAALGAADRLSPAGTASQGVTPASSPADSRTSRSPRASPLTSRFAPKRPQTGKNAALAQPPQPEPRETSEPSPQAPAAQRSPADDSKQDYPPISAVLESPPDPHSDGGAPLQRVPTETKKASKGGFFHFTKSSKTNNQLQSQPHHHSESRSQLKSRAGDAPATAKQGDTSSPGPALRKPISSQPSRSDLSSSGENEATSAQGGTRDAQPLATSTHSKPIRDKDNTSPRNPAAPLPIVVSNLEARGPPPLRTAPAGQERSFRDMMNSAVRNRSEDRNPTREGTTMRSHSREKESRSQSFSLRENGGSTFFSGLKSSSTKATSMLSKGLFGKGMRSASNMEKEHSVDDEHYVLKVINLPLVEQARKTRISKRLENSRDKTEFWMPAFPWRAIDYLNYKGCEVEGLYRVPGSGPQIKRWQRRFDEEHDVNLFDEDDLYDINIIGSMLKAWLRELPDELFPKAAQERISRECSGSEEVPQMLIDELSSLSPFNYYLLFAITCHLSLLLAHSDKNKMDFRNLCICFQPCMKIDAFCFKFLVCDWRDCWKGCLNEGKYIEEEYRLFDQPPPRGLTEPQEPVLEKKQEEVQQPSSSDSSKGSANSAVDQPQQPTTKTLQPSKSSASVDSHTSSISTTLTIGSDREVSRSANDLRPLSPIQPLSPLGFG